MTLFGFFEIFFFFLSGWRRKIRRKHPSGRKMGRPDGKATGTWRRKIRRRPDGTLGVRTDMLLEQKPKTLKILKTRPFFQKIQPNDTKET